MREETTRVDDCAIAGNRRVRPETLDIDAAQDHVSPGFRLMTAHNATVFADVEVAVIPTIRGDVSGNVPAAAAQVADEDPPSGKPGQDRRQTAGEYVLLMAVNHVGGQEQTEKSRMERIGPLAADVPGRAQDANTQSPQPQGLVVGAKAHQERRYLLSHVPRQLQGVTLGPAVEAVVVAEKGGYQVDNATDSVHENQMAKQPWRNALSYQPAFQPQERTFDQEI